MLKQRRRNKRNGCYYYPELDILGISYGDKTSADEEEYKTMSHQLCRHSPQLYSKIDRYVSTSLVLTMQRVAIKRTKRNSQIGLRRPRQGPEFLTQRDNCIRKVHHYYAY